MDEKIREAIELAGAALGGLHSEAAQAILTAAMLEVACHHARTGVGARAEWVKSLRVLGEACLSIARRHAKGG